MYSFSAYNLLPIVLILLFILSLIIKALKFSSRITYTFLWDLYHVCVSITFIILIHFFYQKFHCKVLAWNMHTLQLFAKYACKRVFTMVIFSYLQIKFNSHKIRNIFFSNFDVRSFRTWYSILIYRSRKHKIRDHCEDKIA